MPRKYAVLHQFVVDLDRLLTEAESAFASLRNAPSPGQSEILALFRPIHSLKGICGMVEESKLLVHGLHTLEDALPPLLPVRPVKTATKSNWIAVGESTFEMAREVERIIRMKLEIWKRLGADKNESRGLVVTFLCEGTSIKVWVPVTGLLGLAPQSDAPRFPVKRTVGDLTDSTEYLLIEATEGAIALNVTAIISACTRLEAVQGGVPYSFKEWWAALQKQTSQQGVKRAA